MRAAGATLSLSNVNCYTKSGNFDAYFQADGAGTVLNLPGLTRLSGLGYYQRVYSRGGGRVNLPKLPTITDSYVYLSSDGADAASVPSTTARRINFVVSNAGASTPCQMNTSQLTSVKDELEELQPFEDQSEVEIAASEPEAELPELESIDELKPFDEPALTQSVGSQWQRT